MGSVERKKWASLINIVEQNFRILLNRANSLSEPTEQENCNNYKLRKRQLVSSMLFYTARIISDGIRVAMESNPKREVSEAVGRVQMLQEELLKLQLGTNSLDFQKICENFDEQHFFCPNPLVLFLKMAVDSGHSKPDLDDLQNLLAGLNFKKMSPHVESYTSGMPACIMAIHNPSHYPIISATKDRYDGAEGLVTASEELWNGQLLRLKNSCSDDNQEHIKNLEKLSKNFITETGKRGVKKGREVNINNVGLKKFLQERANDPTQKKFALTDEGDILASWKTDGRYFRSCLLDHYRFSTNRPLKNQKPSRRVWGPMSCAEWFGFVELASSGKNFTHMKLPSSLD